MIGNTAMKELIVGFEHNFANDSRTTFTNNTCRGKFQR